MTALEVPRFKFNSDAQALSHFAPHRLVLLGGGVGSGKTALHPLWVVDRSQFDTGQLHAIFTNTQNQLEKAVLPEIAKWLALAGIEWRYDKRPPTSWFRMWERKGIPIPPGIARYRNIFTTKLGLHVLCGTLHNQSFTQYESLQFGSIRIEEAINNSLDAITKMIERVRCGSGRDFCRAHHRHQAYLNFNPPLGPHPWLFAKLDQLEEAAKKHYNGPPVDHRNWSLLKQGIGDAILIQSRTSDNVANLMDGYEDGLAANYSASTAKKRLEGEIVRDIDGKAYTEWSDANIQSVEYDPNKDLYLCLDFNSEPRAAVLAHPLGRGEGGVEFIGVFGEYIYADRLSDRKFALDLVKGARGFGGESQPKYRDENLRGLPKTWDGLRAHRGRIIAFGDAVGSHRSSHADNLESSWEIVDQVFRQLDTYGKNVPADGNPSPRARVDSVNGKLCNAFGVHALIVDPRCEELIRDFEQVMWDETGLALREWRRGSLGTEWLRTHASDGLGYMIHRLFPLGQDVDRDDRPTIHRRPIVPKRPTLR